MKLLALFGLTSEQPDALSLIKKDHDTIRAWLEKLNATTTRGRVTRTRLFAQLRSLLIAHQEMEERGIYPVLKKIPESRDIIMEGLQEHHSSDLLREELATLPVSSPDWGPKCHVMGEGLDHHLKEEEHTLFVKARLLLSEGRLIALGKRMREIRDSELEKDAPVPRRRGGRTSVPKRPTRRAAAPSSSSSSARKPRKPRR